MARPVETREEIDVVNVDPLFNERQRDRYASRGLGYVVLLNGIAALALLVGLAHATLSAQHIAQLADAMMVFGLGVTAGLVSILFAFLRRSFLMEQSARNFLRWLAIAAACIGAICFLIGLNMARIGVTSAEVSPKPASAATQQGRPAQAGDVKTSMSDVQAAAAKLGAPKVQGNDLYFGDTKVSSDLVDAIVKAHGGVATIFVKSGDNYVRAATTVKKEDGSSAVGTTLTADSPALAKLNNGEPYYGDATVFGKTYDAGYEPIKDASGAVIGAFFVGNHK